MTRRSLFRLSLFFLLPALAIACQANRTAVTQSTPPATRPAAPAVAPEQSTTPAALLTHIRTLASDEFEGRAPGTPGEDRTIHYLVDQFKTIGLQPGNPDGTFIHGVPLTGFTAQPTVSFTAPVGPIELRSPNDVVAWSRQGKTDDVIIDRIERGDTVFHLTAADETGLHARGVSDDVIRAMKQTQRR